METQRIIDTLNEAIDALGDIEAEHCTDQQKRAYEVCVEVRDELLGEEECPCINAMSVAMK
jgi:hypothetical protein